MSDKSSVPKIELTKITINSEFMCKRYMNPDFSDLTLIVEGKEFPVIRNFLAMHSSFFDVLFDGNFEDGQKKELKLEDVKLGPFEILLRYMYFGYIKFESTEQVMLSEVAELAHFLGMPIALQHLEDQMVTIPIAADNVVDIVNVAALLSLENLLECALNFIFENQNSIIENNMFVTLNEAALFKLLDSNEWAISESEILLKLAKWLDVNPTTKRKELLQKIRLPLIAPKELIKDIRGKELFTDDEIFNALLNIPYTSTKNCRNNQYDQYARTKFGRVNNRW